jgi:NRAMP (natural resistance-associated macrophage protein)-like metal ion transporter
MKIAPTATPSGEIRPFLPARGKRPRRTLLAYLAVLGPGLIAANAGNDAGGVTTYSAVGAQFGYSLLWTLPILTISLIVVQEMAARMGAVTGKGLSDLIRENFSLRTTTFVLVSVAVGNGLLVVSEFAGIAASMQVLFPGQSGWIKYPTVPVMAYALWLLVTRGSYKRAERVFLLLTLPFLAYPIADFFAKPNWSAVGHNLVVPSIQLSSVYLLQFVALVGTTITPYMQLYVQSSVAEKGVTTRDYHYERADVVFGSIFGNIISLAIIVATAATLWAHSPGHHGVVIDSAAQAAKGLEPFAGRFAGILFAIGLFGASALAAAVLPISTAYAIGEAFGFETGVEHRLEDAPIFYGILGFLFAFGALITLIPGLPLIQFIIIVQVVQGMLLPIILIAIWRLVNDQELMGRYTNGPLYNLIALVTIGGVIVLSSIYLLVTILSVFGVSIG